MNDPKWGFTCDPDPDHPGWHRWQLKDDTLYNGAVLGRMLVRAESDDTARCRIFPQRHLTNNGGNVHGAATLGLIDVSLFAATYILRGGDAVGASTIDVSAQFISPGDASKPLDSVVELLRETRRLGFLRGLIMQDEAIVASFTGTVRKASQRP